MSSNADFTETAEALVAEGRLDEARALLDAHIHAVPAGWTWLVDRGAEREIAFWSESEFDAYRAFFGPRLGAGLTVTWVGPSYPKAFFLAAGLEAQRGGMAAAAALVERGLALEPDHPHLLLRLATLRARDGRVAEALALAENAASARAWAPEADVREARNAATTYRLRLVAPPVPVGGGSAPPGPARVPTFASLDDAGEDAKAGPLTRLVGRIESTSARVVAVVAALTTVVLFIVILFAMFRTPSDEARVQRFASAIEGYTALESAEPAPTRPYRRGRVVIIDLDTRKIDPIFNLLPPDLRADSPADVGTIVLVRWIPELVDTYYAAHGQPMAGAYVTNAHVFVIDATIGKRVGTKRIRGESPPDRIVRDAGDDTGGYGARPNRALLDYIEALPAFDAAGDTIAIAGASGDPGRPVTDAERTSVPFRSIRLDAAGKVVERPAGQASVFRETLPSGASFEMVAIPGGTFQMGLPDTDVTYDDYARPGHSVSVPPFFIGRTEVTRELWRAVASLPRISRDLNPNPDGEPMPDDGRLPVAVVSWADANEFCLRLERATGRPYRLASEAEWEYACLGGGPGPFASGGRVDPTIANVLVDLEDPDAPRGPVRRAPTPVGSLGVTNGFGLFDMDGNVSEWCADTFHLNYDGAPADGSAWVSGTSDTKRVLRGGAFEVDWTDASARKRFAFDPTVRYTICGLRIALTATPQGGTTP